MVMISALILVAAVVTYYRTHRAHEYWRISFIGSVVSALLLGLLEESSPMTSVLTNVPWCVTVGMVVDEVIHSAIEARCKRSDGLVLRNGYLEKSDEEKGRI